MLHKFSTWSHLSNFDQSDHKYWTKSVTNAWTWWEKSKATLFPACRSWLNFRVRGQFEIKILIGRHINTTYFIWIKKNQTWACNHLKTSTLSADNFQKIVDLEGSTSEPAIRLSNTGQRIPCFDSCHLITKLMSNMCISFPVLWSQTS